MPASVRILVISLPGSPRRARVTEAMARVTVPWSFFDALTGAVGEHHYVPERALHVWGRTLTPSEVGCAASHLGVIGDIDRDPEWDWTLVLEDDVTLDPLFDLQGLAAMCDDLGLDYLRLYARSLPAVRELAWLDQRQLVRFRRSPMGCQAYLISRRGAGLASPRMRNIDRPIDWAMDRFWHNRLPIYALFPFPAIELLSPSTVSKFPDDQARPNAYQTAYRLVYRTGEYIRRALANLRLLARDAALKRRIAVSAWAF